MIGQERLRSSKNIKKLKAGSSTDYLKIGTNSNLADGKYSKQKQGYVDKI
jgi:hypothetical protein